MKKINGCRWFFAVLVLMALNMTGWTAETGGTSKSDNPADKSSDVDAIRAKAEAEQQDRDTEKLLKEGEKTDSDKSWFFFFGPSNSRSVDEPAKPAVKPDDNVPPPVPDEKEEEVRRQKDALKAKYADVEKEILSGNEEMNRVRIRMHETRVRLLKEKKDLAELHQKIMALHRELASKLDRERSMGTLLEDLNRMDAQQLKLENERIRIKNELDRLERKSDAGHN